MAAGQITIEIAAATGSFETDMERASRAARRFQKDTTAAVQGVARATEVSAAQTAAAMRTLPAQFTDVATQLAGGQNPLLVLLQQGGQIKDSFGGVGNTVRALGSILSPTAVAMGVLGTAIAGVGFAAAEGAKQSSDLRDAISLTGNAAGLTAARMDLLAESVATATRQTMGGARDIILELAKSGQVTAGVLGDMAKAVARISEVSGADSSKVAADFAKMSDGVAKWAAEHNKAWNFITVEQYRYIKRLEDQGKAEEAMMVVSKAVLKAQEDQARNLGYLQSAWDTVKKAASSAWDAMLGIGRETTTRQQLDIAIARLDALGGNLSPKAREAAEQRIQFLKEQLKLENQQADSRSRNAAMERQAIADQMEADRKKPAKPEKDRSKPYISDDVFDARDAMVRAAKRAKEESEATGFFNTQLQNQKDRDQKRLDSNSEFLQRLADDNARAEAELISDERARGEALIALERDIERRRVLARSDLTETSMALDEIDRSALLKRRKLEQELTRSADDLAARAGEKMHDDVAKALQDAFLNSRNPAQAFAAGLGAAIYSRVTSSLANALTDAVVGKDGRSGVLGSLISSAIGFFAGDSLTVDPNGQGVPADMPIPPQQRRALGGPVSPGTTYLVGERGPEEFRPSVPGTIVPNSALGTAGGIQVTVVNNTGVQASARAERQRGGGLKIMLDAVKGAIADDYAQGGPLSRTQESIFGARRGPQLVR